MQSRNPFDWHGYGGDKLHNCNNFVQQNFGPTSDARIYNFSFKQPGRYFVTVSNVNAPYFPNQIGNSHGSFEAGPKATAGVPSQLGSGVLANYPPEMTLLPRPCPSCLNGKLIPRGTVSNGVNRHGFNVLLNQPTHWECNICASMFL